MNRSDSFLTVAGLAFFLILCTLGAPYQAHAGAATQLALEAPAGAYDERPVTILVKAVDEAGIVDIGYNGTATVSADIGVLSTGDGAFTELAQPGAGNSATADIRNGIGSVTLTGVTAGNTATISAASNAGLTAPPGASIQFYPATATHYRFFNRSDEWGMPADRVDGTISASYYYGYYLRALTALGDTDPSYNGEAWISLTESNPNASADVYWNDIPTTFSSGTATPSIRNTEPEEVTVIAAGDLVAGQVVIDFPATVDPPAGQTVSGQIDTWDNTAGTYCSALLFAPDAPDRQNWKALYHGHDPESQYEESPKTGGTYEINNVPDGTYILYAKATGYLFFETPITISGGAVTQDIDLQRGAVISGTVQPAGTTGSVMLRNTETHLREASADLITGDSGTGYFISGLAAGTYDLFFYRDGTLPDTCAHQRITFAANEEKNDVNFTFPDVGSISGAADFHQGIDVHLYPAGVRSGVVRSEYVYSDTYAFTNLPPGNYDLMAKLYDYPTPIPLALDIPVTAGQDTVRDLTFHPNLGQLQITVQTSDGIAEETGEMRLFPVGTADLRPGYPPIPYYNAGFSSGSTSTVYDIYPGDYDLWVMADSSTLPYTRVSITIPDTEGGATVSQTVTLNRGPVSRISGSVTWKDSGTPQKWVGVAIIRDGMIYGYGNTDTDGVFRITHVPRGTYDIRLFKGGPHWMFEELQWDMAGLLVPGQLVVNDGTQVGGLNFTIEPRGTVTLTAPVDNTEVRGTAPTLSWEPYPGASNYLVVIDEIADDINAYWPPATFAWGWEPPAMIHEVTGNSFTLGQQEGIRHLGEGFDINPCRPYAWIVYALPAPYESLQLGEEGFAGDFEAIALSDFQVFWTGDTSLICPDSLIINASFEDMTAAPDPDGWTLNHVDGIDDIAVDTTTAAFGLNALVLHSDPTGGSWASPRIMATQDLGINQEAGGKRYTLKAQIARDPLGPGLSGDAIGFNLVVTDASGSRQLPILTGNPDQPADGMFYTLTGSVVLTEDVLSVDRIEVVKSGPGRFWIDCLELNAETVQFFAISGTVINGTVGFGGATVTLSGGELAAPVVTSSAADGSYRFAQLLPGTYTLSPEKTGYLLDPDTATVTITNGDIEQNFAISRLTAVLSGTIKTSAPGYPVGILNAQVTISGADGTFSTTTTQDGTWEIANVPYGTYTVTVSAADHQGETITGIVVSEETVVVTAPDYELVVTGSQPNPWDVNLSGTLDLPDIIYGLQVLSDTRAE